MSSFIVADTPERAALREAVGKLAGRYGHDDDGGADLDGTARARCGAAAAS